MTPRALLVGLGPIGMEIGKALLARGVEIAGAADPAWGSRTLDEVFSGTGTFTFTGRSQSVFPTAGALYASTERRPGDVCVLCTGSRMPSVAPQIEEAL